MNWQIGLGVVATILIVIAVWSFIRPQSGAPYRLTSKEAGKYGYSIWRYFKGAWKMTEDFSAPGYMPGPAPTGKARFEGQCTRVISVKRPAGS
ncbi:MAG TPA: hypothetical protein VL371_22160 [Gemmataceae bacterium]|jgi:hypothetical protein|nr:hypothetical protein [Gemmataceae bacterium]